MILSHGRRYCDMQKAQRRTRCGHQVSSVRGPRWLLFVVVYLFVAMLTRPFLPHRSIATHHRPSPTALFDLGSAAWTKNQPKPVFAEVEQEEEEGEK